MLDRARASDFVTKSGYKAFSAMRGRAFPDEQDRLVIEGIERENKETVERATAFYALLANDTELSELVIFTNGVCIKELADALAVNKTLTKLQLSGCELNPDHAQLLFKALQVNTTLREVSFSNNQFGPTVGGVIAECLRNNRTLIHLGLHQNWLGNDAVRLILEALSENTRMEKIELSLNQVKTSITDTVVHLLEHNKTLRSMVLSSNFIAPEGIKKIYTAAYQNKIHVDCNFNGWEEGNTTDWGGPERHYPVVYYSEASSAPEVSSTLSLTAGESASSASSNTRPLPRSFIPHGSSLSQPQSSGEKKRFHLSEPLDIASSS